MAPVVIGGRYILQNRLGGGGQGEVYEALDTNEGDVVAIKLLTTIPPGGPWAEARILRRLTDPHILPIRNADVAAGQPYLVTDLAQHGTLETRLNASGNCGLDVDDVVGWLRDACHGVARAQDVRLLHNDLKPANFFLDARGECLVGDFGAATLLPVGVTTVRPHAATAETAAPEIAAGWNTLAATASFRSDIYSLGASGYWMLAAQTPNDFGGLTDVGAKMAVVAAQLPPRLRDVAPHVPTQVASTIERAMARDPNDRLAPRAADRRAPSPRCLLARRARGRREHFRYLSRVGATVETAHRHDAARVEWKPHHQGLSRHATTEVGASDSSRHTTT